MQISPADKALVDTLPRYKSRKVVEVFDEVSQLADAVINLMCLDTKDARATKFYKQGTAALGLADAALAEKDQPS